MQNQTISQNEKYYSKSRLIKAGSLLLLAIAVLVINSCRKDIATSLQQQLAGDPDLAQAKAWYESTYPDAPAAGSSNGLVSKVRHQPIPT